MKRYLITGFSGFVAYYFLKQLDKRHAEKTEVLGLDLREPQNFKAEYDFKNLDLKFLAANLLDAAAFEGAIKEFRPDYILHLAAVSSVGESWKNPAACFVNNTNVFLNLVEAVRNNGIKCRILSVGSSEEYGNVSKDDVPLLEDRRLVPLSPYAIARVSQEALSKCYVDSYGQDIIMTRSFNHIGPRQRDAFVIPSFVKQITYAALQGKKQMELTAGNTSVIRDFTDVRDVARAYDLLLLKGKAGEIYNVCGGKGLSLKEIIAAIAKKLGVEAQIKTDPALIRPNDNMIVVGDNSKIQRDAGWQPEFSLDQTLDAMIEYWKQRYSLECGQQQ